MPEGDNIHTLATALEPMVSGKTVKACLLGRAWTYAVAGGGEEGVAHIIRMIREEMNVAMALTGKQRLSDLGADVLDR